MLKRIGKYVADNKRAIEQFNGREGETATFLSRCPLKFNGLGGGFAPRHLNRSVLSGLTEAMRNARQNLYCLLLNLL